MGRITRSWNHALDYIIYPEREISFVSVLPRPGHVAGVITKSLISYMNLHGIWINSLEGVDFSSSGRTRNWRECFIFLVGTFYDFTGLTILYYQITLYP